MGKRKRRKKRRFVSSLERETIYSITAVLLLVLAFFFTLAAFDRAGVAGTYLYDTFSLLAGVGYVLLPVLSLLLAVALFRSRHQDLLGIPQFIGALLFLLGGLGMIDLVFAERGGLIGGIIRAPLVQLFDGYVAGAVMLAVLVIGLIVMFNLTTVHFQQFFKLLWRREKKEKKEKDDLTIYETEEEEQEPEESAPTPSEDESESQPEGVGKETQEAKKRGLFGMGKKSDELEITASEVSAGIHAQTKPYSPPPLSLLAQEKGKANAGDVKANANIIKRTLANFGIDVEIEEVTVGPTITRYAIKPAEGVRLSRILGLQNNLELALAAHPVRIEAPIPGKSLVGIEVPNTAKSTVGLASLLSSKEFTEHPKPLAFPLGRNVSGGVRVAALSTMPHLLIAGSTGAGKSVLIHTITTSLLYQNSPQILKLILADPKRVELTLYKDIPHLLTPVITDAKKAVLALKWLTGEMERRYGLLEEYAVRDINSYHATVLKPALEKGIENEKDAPETLPYIVLVIDELADIMSAYPRELEAAIVRLAQMSRAVGIHLVLSTQRPSVNVITGLIKANIPARIALQVTSQVDSRTILDMAGAEKLLGAGDMLYLSADMAKPVRLQSGFISERDVKKVSTYLKRHRDGDEEDELSFSEDNIDDALENGSGFDDDEEDELYEDARELVLEAGKASTSYLQRKLRVGYARAARLIDMLEERGVVGPPDGSRPRDVLEPKDNQEL